MSDTAVPGRSSTIHSGPCASSPLLLIRSLLFLTYLFFSLAIQCCLSIPISSFQFRTLLFCYCLSMPVCVPSELFISYPILPILFVLFRFEQFLSNTADSFHCVTFQAVPLLPFQSKTNNSLPTQSVLFLCCRFVPFHSELIFCHPFLYCQSKRVLS